MLNISMRKNNARKRLRAACTTLNHIFWFFASLDDQTLYFLLKENKPLPDKITNVEFKGVNSHTKKDMLLSFKMTFSNGKSNYTIINLKHLNRVAAGYTHDNPLRKAAKDAIDYLRELSDFVDASFSRSWDIATIVQNPKLRHGHLDKLPRLETLKV